MFMIYMNTFVDSQLLKGISKSERLRMPITVGQFSPSSVVKENSFMTLKIDNIGSVLQIRL